MGLVICVARMSQFKSIVSERERLNAIIEPFDLVAKLGIIDITIHDVEKSLKKIISAEEEEKLTLPARAMDKYCETYLTDIEKSNASLDKLRSVIRTQVIPPKLFDYYVHYDLNILEQIATRL